MLRLVTSHFTGYKEVSTTGSDIMGLSYCFACPEENRACLVLSLAQAGRAGSKPEHMLYPPACALVCSTNQYVSRYFILCGSGGRCCKVIINEMLVNTRS